MFDEKEMFKNPKHFFILLISFSVFFLVINFFSFQEHILKAGSIFIKPMQEFSFDSSESMKDFFGVFREIKVLRNDYFDLQEAYLKLEAKSDPISALFEENATLRKQLGFDSEKREIVLAEILYQDLNLRNESMLVNKGSKDGLQEGDIVSIGNLYIGLLATVQENTSKVRLATSRASSLKVMILDANVDSENKDFLPQAYLTGVAIGYSNSIRIENIDAHGTLNEGDSVLINDEKVGKYFYLGNVSSIDQDPTASYRSCSVKLPVEYTSLKYVFVERRQ